MELVFQTTTNGLLMFAGAPTGSPSRICTAANIVCIDSTATGTTQRLWTWDSTTGAWVQFPNIT